MVSETEQKILDGVAANGWFLVNYVPREGSDDADEFFSYTVGVAASAGWPELICLGLPAAQAETLLRATLGDCWTNQTAPSAGLLLHQVVQKMTAKLVEFDAAAERYFHYADWFAQQQGSPPPARLQLLWPDRDGNLPDSPDCAPAVRDAQTAQDRP